MKTDDLTFKRKTDDYIFNDIKPQIKDFMKEMINKAKHEDKIINWEKFLEYCKDFGIKEMPNILTVPNCLIELCVKEVKEEFYSY